MTMKPAGLWKNLERFAAPAAVLAEWQKVLGGDFDGFQDFLVPTDELALDYPCTNRPSCACRHEVVPLRMVAGCRCEPRDCESIVLEPKDVLIYAVDTRKLCGAIRIPLGFEAPPDENALVDGTRGTWRVGTYGPARAPVFLTMRLTEGEFVAELEWLVGSQGEPFILLAPTEQHKTSTVQGILQRQRCAFVPLCWSLALHGAGRFTATGSIQPILDRFSEGLAEGKGLVTTVEKIGRDIAAVAKDKYELRKENEDLRQMLAGGYLKFVRSVEPVDACWFFFILAYGDRAKAARELGVDQRRFYERVKSWAAKGPAYKRMFALVECRKTSLRKGPVPLGMSLQSGGVHDEAENPETLAAVLEQVKAGKLSQDGYPGLLQEILGALLEMDANTWQAIRAELVGNILEEVPQ
jgi:hypothetical protein